MTVRLKVMVAMSMGLLVLWAAVLFPLVLRLHHGVERGAPMVTIGGPFRLVDTTGKIVTDKTYRGKWMLVYFGYTFCPDACPTALNNMAAALEKLASNAKNLRLVFITIDPTRDTVPVMS
jgi:cytochrome oxidase Cu insertion factor (SCO1/SenC/PrrC family)